ncbi:glycosyltransferase [bacterium]|nr:glycosyltransferase [bacterium]
MIDIIIPTYQNWPELIKCLNGLMLQSFHRFRVLICVDGAPDFDMKELNFSEYTFESQILFHPGKKHCGRNATRNLALPHIQAKYIVTIDSDIIPANDLLKNHFKLLSERPCISQGKIQYLNVKNNDWADYIQSRGKNKYRHLSELPYYYLTTGNVGMPAYCFIEIGGQDPNMRTYGGGDTEFAYRLHQAYHLPVIYNTYAEGMSNMNKSWHDALDQMKEFGAVNLPYIRNKHPKFDQLFRIDRFESKKPINRLCQLLFNRLFKKIVMLCVPVSLRPIRRKLIHFLVSYQIYKGYKSYLQKK